MTSLKLNEDKNSKISLNNYKIEKEDMAKEINFVYELKDLDINKKEEFEKNLSNIDEIQNNFNKNLDIFSFMDENEKNENSTFFEIENFDKDKMNALDQSKNMEKSLFSPFYKKIPINQIRKIIEKDNIIYKRNNNITLEHYSKRNKFLGKKTKRIKNDGKNNYKEGNDFLLNISKTFSLPNLPISQNISYKKKILRFYNSPIPIRTPKSNKSGN